MEFEMTASLEDYIESIYLICEKNKVARVKDIADDLSVKKSSVNNAIKELKELGLINHEPYGFIEMTDRGKKKAKEVFKKHKLLTQLLRDVLCVSEKTAGEDACRIEHCISEETFQKLEEFIDKVHQKENIFEGIEKK